MKESEGCYRPNFAGEGRITSAILSGKSGYLPASILCVLNKSSPNMYLEDIAKSAGVARSTVGTLLLEMMGENLVESNKSDRRTSYSITDAGRLLYRIKK